MPVVHSEIISEDKLLASDVEKCTRHLASLHVQACMSVSRPKAQIPHYVKGLVKTPAASTPSQATIPKPGRFLSLTGK